MMHRNGDENGSTFRRNEEICGNEKLTCVVQSTTKCKMNVGPISDLYAIISENGKSRPGSPGSRVSSSSPQKADDASKRSSTSGGCPDNSFLRGQDLQQFVMTSDSLEADIAASLLQEEMHPSPPSVTSKVHSLNDIKARKGASVLPNSYLQSASEVVVSDHQGTMELNTMSIGCLSLLDGLDMQIGTFSHAVVGEMPWVGNEAGRLNEMRDSLEDDFYPGQDSVQRAGADSDISTRTTLSLGRLPPLLSETANEGDDGHLIRRDLSTEKIESDINARKCMLMDFFHTPHSAPPGETILSRSEHTTFSAPQPLTALAGKSSGPPTLGPRLAPPSSSSGVPPRKDRILDRGSAPRNHLTTASSTLGGPKGPGVSASSSSGSKKYENSFSNSHLDIKDMNPAFGFGGLGPEGHINSELGFFNSDDHMGLDIQCMSIDDGGYPIGTNIEVRKVSSSDWNEPWSRQGISSSSGASTTSLLGIDLDSATGHNVVINALDEFHDNEFMTFSFPSTSGDALENTYTNAVSHYPPIEPVVVPIPAVAENAVLTFAELQLIQHQQQTGTMASAALSQAKEIPMMLPITVARQSPHTATSRTLKHGFKCANKQLVVRKDGLGVIGVNAPLSPTNDAKRLKIVKKKSYAQATSLTSTSIYTPSSSLISGPGFNSSNITLAGECKPTGGISDTVFHGFRRRSKLSEAELEDQRALEQAGDGGLLAARGRYKCGRCGQLKTNHVCEYYEDTSVCSTATQRALEIIDPTTSAPWDGERFLIVGIKRLADQLQGAGSEGADRSGMEGSGTGDSAAGSKSGVANNGSNPDAKNVDGKDASSNGGNSSADGGSGGILLNSGTRIGMGLKLGLVHFAEDVEGDEWRMSVQNSARRSSGIPDSPFDSIFQLRAALIPTFPVDFDSNTTTPSSSTPYIPTPTTPYIPINPEEVMSVLHALEEKAEDSDGEKEEERFGDRPSEVPNSASMSIATSGLCSPIGTGGISLSDTVSEQSLRASLANRAARSRRAS